ncbi:MAG: bifunctional diaminohydroxyphosphoribosylaminopyrimidine deaminase/5-amino-6-(5-phosphoribosylamino)uracil reductase RibD [Bacteroidales bacterium]|nr:bifunctional diaminohydroxyphosphoribosylaminopyrimidine deaminase/5-amino-6-(5-phosphoribosylamino)uracil reductase RibD [Bacteroidales bacterium]
MDEKLYMQRCLDLAVNGVGHVLSNPLVGCVIVKNGKIIGEGFHYKYGKEHAEINAIKSVKDKSLLEGSTMYVTLEPCIHYGKTPPCVDEIIKHKIGKVVISAKDPNPLVNGKGIEKLKKNGVKVKIGTLIEEYRWINRRFFTFHESKRPYIILKWAQSADGFISPNDSSIKWFTSKTSQLLVHKWRAEEMAILVGGNTIIKDNPFLTVREYCGNNPLRVVLSNTQLPENLNIFDKTSHTIIFSKNKSVSYKNAEVVYINDNDNYYNIIFHTLYEKGISSVIVEGGLKTLNGFINNNIWDEVRIFIAKDKYFRKGVKAPAFKFNCQKVFEIENDSVLYFYR